MMKRNILRKKLLLPLLFLLSLCLCACGKNASSEGAGLKDGSYEVAVSLSGGSGKASISSPASLKVENGRMTATIEWSSRHYDYMIVEGEKYLPLSTEGNSTFAIPVPALDQAFEVIADTTAMSTPHEITYTLTFSLDRKEDEARDAETSMPEGGSYSYEVGSEISTSLSYDSSMELKEARGFRVDYYVGKNQTDLADGKQAEEKQPAEKKQPADKNQQAGTEQPVNDRYALIQLSGDQTFLLIPEGAEAPEDLPGNIQLLYRPLNRVYLVASATMDMYRSIDALDQIRFSGLKEDAWFLPEVAEEMKAGHILYAGKYSAPDYEKILAENCNLAIENTMIYHTPEVKEQLERFGITVFVDYSSYETEPLARMEWVKLYGLLADQSDKAQAVFEEQAHAFARIGKEKKEASVAFFYLTNDGQVNVRRSNDYLPKMISLAGGNYIFDDLGQDEGSNSSTISLQMEEFYATAKDADYFIYNSTTVEELTTIQELVEKNALLGKCKAVEDKKVYCTSKNLYQSSMELGTIVGDMEKMLNGQDEEMTYLYRLQ